MEFFALDEGLARLEAELPSAHARQRLDVVLALAWQLRQRDTGRALALADEAQILLTRLDLPETAQRGVLARLMLVRGEAKWLFAELDAAKALARDALQEFAGLADANGCADAHWLLAMVADDQGELALRDVELGAVLADDGDPVRVGVAQAALARFATFCDVNAAMEHWGARFAGGKTGLHPAAGCWAEDFLGSAAKQSSDFGRSILHRTETHALALASGQNRRAIIAAINIGDSLGSLNDYHAALEWVQRALDLARRHGWPGLLGIALKQTAQNLRHVRRHDAARDMLREALALMAPVAASRSYAVALLHMGDIELDGKDYASALATFQLLSQRADALGQPDMQTQARRGSAHALFQLGQPHQAIANAEAALALGKAAADQIAALRIMADIHANHALPPPLRMSRASAPLHFLHQALALAATIEGYIIPGELLDAVACAYDLIGDTGAAYRFALQANAAREKMHNREATNRAIALQVTHATERARAEGEHHRQLAASEILRAEALQQNSETLERLGTIGQEITAHLDARQVFEALNRHAHHLLNANGFAIFLVDPDGLHLNLAFGTENGEQLRPWRVDLADPEATSARCVRERCEALVDQDPVLEDPTLIPGTHPTLSALFAPLCLAERVLGVMTIQSHKRHAYGAREQLIFRTLCAYAAIALANSQAHGELAAAHLRLKETQQQLILQEKMAGLGTLTAGVAHEINNPTNFAHVGAQNLRADITEFQHFVHEIIEADAAPEIRAAFDKRFTKLADHAKVILHGTERIKGIVMDLRAFTRLDEANKKAVRLAECLHSTLNLMRASWLEKVAFVTEFADDPLVQCWPALLNQVFMNLLVNACQACAAKHEKCGEGKGEVVIRMRQRDGNLEIDFADNGIGMTAEVQTRIMEPFFTTKTVGEGTGLGLSIAYGIVQKHGGDLLIASVPGQGTCFTLVVPLTEGAVGGNG